MKEASSVIRCPGCKGVAAVVEDAGAVSLQHRGRKWRLSAGISQPPICLEYYCPTCDQWHTVTLSEVGTAPILSLSGVGSQPGSIRSEQNEALVLETAI